MWDEDGQVGVAEREVGGDVDRHHARESAGGAHVDRFDARMRERGAHEARLERAIAILVYVVREMAVAAQQPVVLDPLHSRTEPARRHLVSSAARWTARRIDAYPVQRHRLPAIPS